VFFLRDFLEKIPSVIRKMTAIATDFIPYSTHVSVDFGIPSKNIRKIRKNIAAKTLSKI